MKEKESIQERLQPSPRGKRNEERHNIISSFEHYSSSDTNPQHHLCPKSSDSWCFCQKVLPLGEVPSSHSRVKVSVSLDSFSSYERCMKVSKWWHDEKDASKDTHRTQMNHSTADCGSIVQNTGTHLRKNLTVLWLMQSVSTMQGTRRVLFMKAWVFQAHTLLKNT